MQAAVVAGNPTEAAAQAKALFDKERWSEAAQALHVPQAYIQEVLRTP